MLDNVVDGPRADDTGGGGGGGGGTCPMLVGGRFLLRDISTGVECFRGTASFCSRCLEAGISKVRGRLFLG